MTPAQRARPTAQRGFQHGQYQPIRIANTVNTAGQVICHTRTPNGIDSDILRQRSSSLVITARPTIVVADEQRSDDPDHYAAAMGIRFRKSFKLGPARVTMGRKSGSVSFGGKGFRVTKSTTGRRTTTVGPLSWSKTPGHRRRQTHRQAAPVQQEFTQLSPEELARRRRINKRTLIVAGILMLAIVLLSVIF